MSLFSRCVEFVLTVISQLLLLLGLVLFGAFASDVMVPEGAILLWGTSAVLLALLALKFYVGSQADKMSLKVGTVTRGSPEEKDAERVYFLFVLAEYLQALIIAFSFAVIPLAFVLSTNTFFLSGHTAVVILIVCVSWKQSRRLEVLQKSRGYQK